MEKYEIIGKDVWGVKAKNLINVTNCSVCRYNGYKCSAINCGEFFYLKDEEIEKVENKKSYTVIEKNDYGFLVEGYIGLNVCNICKFTKSKIPFCYTFCGEDTNNYFLPDSEAEKLESETELKAKNEELIKFLEDNIECCKIHEIQKNSTDPVDIATVAMYITYKNVLEFIKNQK